MKIDDIKPGMTVWTRIGQEKVQVRVVQIEEKTSYRTGRSLRRVRVARVDNGKVLPKARASSALHATRDFLESAQAPARAAQKAAREALARKKFAEQGEKIGTVTSTGVPVGKVKKGSFVIRFSPTEGKTVEGYLVGPYFGIEKSVEKYGKDKGVWWRLTHLPTGLLAGRYHSKALAAHVAAEITKKVGAALDNRDQNAIYPHIAPYAEFTRQAREGESIDEFMTRDASVKTAAAALDAEQKSAERTWKNRRVFFESGPASSIYAKAGVVSSVKVTNGEVILSGTTDGLERSFTASSKDAKVGIAPQDIAWKEFAQGGVVDHIARLKGNRYIISHVASKFYLSSEHHDYEKRIRGVSNPIEFASLFEAKNFARQYATGEVTKARLIKEIYSKVRPSEKRQDGKKHVAQLVGSSKWTVLEDLDWGDLIKLHEASKKMPVPPKEPSPPRTPRAAPVKIVRHDEVIKMPKDVKLSSYDTIGVWKGNLATVEQPSSRYESHPLPASKEVFDPEKMARNTWVRLFRGRTHGLAPIPANRYPSEVIGKTFHVLRPDQPYEGNLGSFISSGHGYTASTVEFTFGPNESYWVKVDKLSDLSGSESLALVSYWRALPGVYQADGITLDHLKKVDGKSWSQVQAMNHETTNAFDRWLYELALGYTGGRDEKKDEEVWSAIRAVYALNAKGDPKWIFHRKAAKPRPFAGAKLTPRGGVREGGAGRAAFQAKAAAGLRAGSENAKRVAASEAYQQKRLARAERLEERAAKKEREQEAIHERGRQMGNIMMGTPILVGHHSEKRHRRDVEKLHRGMSKSVELGKEAVELRSRAKAARSEHSIFSDDPEAVRKLKDKANALIADLEKMRALNKLIGRGAKLQVRNRSPEDDIAAREKLQAADYSSRLIDQALTPDFAGRIGIPDYSLTNMSAELRRVEKRIAELKKTEERQGREQTIGETRIVEEENRVRLFFPDKPDEETRKKLKSHGFHWSPTEGAWQRHASEGAWYQAGVIASSITPAEGTAKPFAGAKLTPRDGGRFRLGGSPKTITPRGEMRAGGAGRASFQAKAAAGLRYAQPKAKPKPFAGAKLSPRDGGRFRLGGSPKTITPRGSMRVKPSQEAREKLFEYARQAGARSDSAYKSFGGADVAEAPVWMHERNVYVAVAGGLSFDEAFEHENKSWKAYAEKNNAKIKESAKIARGPRAGQSVIGHRYTSPELFEGKRSHIQFMVNKALGGEAKAPSSYQVPPKPQPSGLDPVYWVQSKKQQIREASELTGVPIHAIEHEMEHTRDPAEAARIANDHLQTDRDYYKKLDLMEAGALDQAIKTRRGRKLKGKGGTKLARVRTDCGPEIGGCVMVRSYWRRGGKKKPQSKLAKSLQKRAAAAKKG